MSDEIAKLKVELEALNLQCQLARDHEIRHALQRTRLETARMQLMLKIVDAAASSSTLSAAAPWLLGRTAPDAVRIVPVPAMRREAPSAKQEAPTPKRKRKPEGLPTLKTMVLGVLENGDTPKAGMRPFEVAEIVRRMWWPEVRTPEVGAVLWRLAAEGRLEHAGGRYKLNGHGN